MNNVLSKPPNLLLSSIPWEDIKEELRDCIKTEFASTLKREPQEVEDFLTENEARTLLQVSKVSLKKWRDEGTIPFYRFGSRIRYKRSELINSATVSKKLKGRRVAL